MSAVTFPASLGGDGVAYSDDGSTAASLTAGGHKTRLFAALQQLIDAAQSATDSAAASTGTTGANGTSTTSIASLPATGADTATITTQSGKTWVAGQPVIMADTAAPATRWITGLVKSYSGTSLVVTVFDAFGTFPGASWTISPCAFNRPSGQALVTTAQSVTTVSTTQNRQIIKFSAAANSSIVLPAPADAGAGWFCYVQNATAWPSFIVLSLTASGSTIDGQSLIRMFAPEMRMVYSTGAEWLSIVIRPMAVLFTSSGTFYRPPGYSGFRVRTIGGGGGGGSGPCYSTGGGSGGGSGGGGTEVFSHIPAWMVPDTVPVIVGAGGTGALGVSTSGATGNTGVAGGLSSFGSFLSAAGGPGGLGGVQQSGQSNTVAPVAVNATLASAAEDILTARVQNGNAGSAVNPALLGGPGVNATYDYIAARNAATTLHGGGGGAAGRSFANGLYGPASVAGKNGRGGGLAQAYSGTGGAAGTNGGPGGNGYSGGGGGAGGGATAFPTASGAGGSGGDGLVLVIGVV